MTVREYAKRIGVKRGTVKRWVYEGMPVERHGTRVIVREAAADEWVRANRAGSIAFNRAPRVYLARAANGLVKIGFSSDLERRERELSSEAKCNVRIVASMPGDRRLETELQQRFAAERACGEWFHPGGEAEAIVAAFEEA